MEPMDAVERAVRAAGPAGTRLATPTGGGSFVVHELTSDALVLLLGEKEARTTFPWAKLEGVVPYLAGRGWVPLGGTSDVSSQDGTLDAFLKTIVSRATAGWMAVVHEKAGIVELDCQRPAKFRLL
jgi:hypothetical protein